MNITDTTTVATSNFSKQNTPKAIETIGNVLLLVGAAGATVALLPVSAPLVATIGAYCAFAGALGKLITKFFGIAE